MAAMPLPAAARTAVVVMSRVCRSVLVVRKVKRSVGSGTASDIRKYEFR
jgi:hypothetical protein